MERVAALWPSGGTLLGAGAIALAAAALFGWVAVRLRGRGGAVAYTRKAFHFGIFTVAGVVHLVLGDSGVFVYGTVVALVVLYSVVRGSGHPLFDVLARPSDAPREGWFIVAPLVTTAVGGLTALLLFGRFATVGFLVAGWGDAAGEPVGARWGRHRFRVPSMRGVQATRTLEGSVAVFAAGALAAYGALVSVGVGLDTAAFVALVVALAAAITEAVSTHGIDNLTVQVVASGVAWAILRA